jgi:hypothetical protein
LCISCLFQHVKYTCHSIEDTMHVPSGHVHGLPTPRDSDPFKSIIYQTYPKPNIKSLARKPEEPVCPKIGSKCETLPPISPKTTIIKGIPTVRTDVKCPPVRRLADFQVLDDVVFQCHSTKEPIW